MKTQITIIAVILLVLGVIISLTAGYKAGRGDGFRAGVASVPSVYEHVQGIRVLQHLLGVQVDGVLGNETLSAYKQYDRDNIGFVEDKLK